MCRELGRHEGTERELEVSVNEVECVRMEMQGRVCLRMEKKREGRRAEICSAWWPDGMAEKRSEAKGLGA